jgi:hypothetical protein
MTRVGWLADNPGYVGGAELTERELRAACPDGVEIVDCPPGHVQPCDVYAIHNCVTYTVEDLKRVADPPAYKLWNDVGSWYGEDMRGWLDVHARPICISPLQAGYMGYKDPLIIPPPIGLDRFQRAAERVNGDRRGAVSVGSWRSRGKGAHRAQQWAEGNGGIDFYGGGVFAPPGSREIAPPGLPAILARYRTFVYLPEVIEPFGRCVAEAWAAGCELVINGLVGARYWIEEQPDRLATAAEDFWTALLT